MFWNMKVTVILIIIDALETVFKGLERKLEELEIGGQTESIQTAVLLRSARILRRVLETWEGKDHHSTLVSKTCKD